MTTNKKIKVGVMLSGCGVFDGAEIFEAAFTLLCLDRAGAEVIMFAPNVDQLHVINHLKGEPAEGEKRNVLVEAARIARGNIRDAAEVKVDEFDALILPGGFGAAKNLSTFAVDGPGCTVNPDAERLVRETNAAGKPIGMMCIAPTLAAKLLGDKGVKVTIGCDKDVAGAIESLGAKHEDRPVTGITIDDANNVVTAPAYMYGDAPLADIFTGIEKLVAEVLRRAD